MLFRAFYRLKDDHATDYTYTPTADADYDTSACLLDDDTSACGGLVPGPKYTWLDDSSGSFCGDAGPSTSSSMLEMPSASSWDELPPLASGSISYTPTARQDHRRTGNIPTAKPKEALKTCLYCDSDCEPDTLRCPGCGAQDWEQDNA